MIEGVEEQYIWSTMWIFTFFVEIYFLDGLLIEDVEMFKA